MIALKGNQGELHETVRDSFILSDQGAKALTVHRAEDEVEITVPTHTRKKKVGKYSTKTA